MIALMRVAVSVTGNRPSSKYFRGAASKTGVGKLFRSFAVIVALLISGCDRNPPRTAAVRYLDDLRQSNYAGCYAMLSDLDRQERTLAEFLTEIPLAPDVGPAWFHPVLQSLQFDLGDATQDGSIAAVPVTVTAPDLPLWERTLDAAAGADQSGAQNAARSLAADDFPKITYVDVIYVIKEHHHWHVVAGLAQRDQIVDLHREAIVDYHQYEFSKVVGTYKTMLADLDRFKFTGAAGLAARYRRELAAVQVVQAEVPAATAYAAKNVTLGDV